MDYVIGIDIGTSGLKSIKVNLDGDVVDSYNVSYHTSNPKSGYSEMDPEIWFQATLESLKYFIEKDVDKEIKGISLSGQMHGLVTVDAKGEVVRPAILWNDTRTSQEVKFLLKEIGLQKFLEETQNTVLEGFTLPKLLWVKKHEPDHFKQIDKIMMPKDYVAFRLTGNIFTEPSDASGTSMFNVKTGEWSELILTELGINHNILPRVIPSHSKNGNLSEGIKKKLNQSHEISVYQGGADNACGALGSGITDDQLQMVSIGTSGVALSIQNDNDFSNDGTVHYFSHCIPDQKYIMGVTLSAGFSLSWFKNTIGNVENYEEFLKDIAKVPAGSHGILYTPYLLGERTPYNDTAIRSSFTGLDATTTKADLKRAVIEGVTFSINESIEIIRKSGKQVNKIVSIGGGAKNSDWLQIQADVFNSNIVTLKKEQGPAYGAAMLAAMGEEWFDNYNDLIKRWIGYKSEINPNATDQKIYQKLFPIYKTVFKSTKSISEQLLAFK